MQNYKHKSQRLSCELVFDKMVSDSSTDLHSSLFSSKIIHKLTTNNVVHLELVVKYGSKKPQFLKDYWILISDWPLSVLVLDTICVCCSSADLSLISHSQSSDWSSFSHTKGQTFSTQVTSLSADSRLLWPKVWLGFDSNSETVGVFLFILEFSWLFLFIGSHQTNPVWGWWSSFS